MNTIPKVSVIIPALNEADNLAHVLPLIPAFVYEVILVDGNSTDNTIQIAQEIMPKIKVVLQESKGKGAALRTGFKLASGQIVVMLDADGSTDPREIPAFVEALMRGADFAKGSRFTSHQRSGSTDMTTLRFVGNLGLTTLANLLFQTDCTDITYGYNATWRKHQGLLALEINGWANEIINAIRASTNNLKVVEVPSFEHNRISGQAKLQTWSAGWTILKAMVKERLGVTIQKPEPISSQLSLESEGAAIYEKALVR